MSKVAGVETNEFSRFVDHTLATPWEGLISDIEKAIRSMQQRKKTAPQSSSYTAGSSSEDSKKVTVTSSTNNPLENHRISIQYNNIEFVLEEFNIQQVELTHTSIEHNWIREKLHLSEFWLLYPNMVRGSEYDHQLFMTVSSAFSIAVKAVIATSCPLFCTVSLIRLSDDNSSSRRLDFQLIDHLLGYQYLTTQQIWIRYDSTSYDKVTRKHVLYFYDGIRKLYQKKVKILGLDRVIGNYPNASTDQILEHFTSSISHYFEYDAMTWLSICIPFQSISAGNFATNYLLQYVSQLLQQPNESASTYPLLYQKVMLDKVRVAIEFHELKQHSIIDNETYSTFLPSRQPPAFWKLTATFHTIPFTASTSTAGAINSTSNSSASSSGNNAIGQNGQVMEESDVMCHTIWRSKVMQKWLSFLLLMYYISNNHNNLYRDNVTMESRFFNEKYFDEVGLEELRQLLTYFSPSLQQSFFTNVFSEEFLLRFPSFATMYTSAKSGGNTNAESSRQSSSSAPNPVHSSPNSSRSKSLTPTISIASDDNNNTASSSSHQPALLSSTIGKEDDELNEAAEASLVETLVNILLRKSTGDSTSPNTPTNKSSTASALSPGKPNSEAVAESDQHDFGTNWIRFFALLVGLHHDVKASGMMKLWQACMREFQTVFDDNQGVTWSKTMQSHLSKGKKTTSSCKDRGCPIFCQPLWDDSLRKKANEGIMTSCPQLSSSLLIQKLQMIHFCIVMKEESPIYQFTKNTSLVNDEVVYNPRLFKRLPMTKDILAVQKHIVKKFLGEGKQSNPRDNPMLPYQVRYPSLLSDINAFKAANPHADLEVFCKWYGILDDVESKASKKCYHQHHDGINSNGSEDDDLEASDALDKEKLMQTLTEIWQDVGVGKSCDEQKALFHAEKELGKALAFIDRMQTFQFASELLFQVIQWSIESFEHTINKYLFATPTATDDIAATTKSTGIKILDHKMTTLKSLTKKIAIILKEKNAPKPSMSTAATPSSSPVPTEMLPTADPVQVSNLPMQQDATPNRLTQDMELFQLFDKVTSQIEEIEVLLSKMTQVNVMIHTIHDAEEDRKNMLDKWIKHHQQTIHEEYSLQSEDEVKALRSIIKSIHNRNGKGHEWYSYDGRELGLPHSKDFLLKSYRKSFPNGPGSSSMVHSTAISRSSTEMALASPNSTDDVSTAAIKLDFQDEMVGSEKEEIIEKEIEPVKEVQDFEFLASTDGASIRVICSVAERD